MTRLRSFAWLVCVVFLAAAAPAHAQEDACKQFAWPLDREKAWFEGKADALETGAKVDKLVDGAYRITLQPAKDIGFVLPPEGKPKADMPNGAVLSIARLEKPGRYQVTLSDEAWIDMIQNGGFAKSVEHTGVRGCKGLRKSVRFDLQSRPLVVQLSGASAATISLAIRRLD